MALFSFHADIVKRSTGRSSVAAAAYRAGEKMRDERTGLTHDYTRKTGIVYSEIMLPENAPNEYEDRYIFWNAVEKADTRKDSQTARTIDVALQTEFDLQEQIEDLQKFIQENFVSAGMCADYAIHDTGDGNPHAHIMLTMRHVTPEGFGGKNRDWNETPLLEGWRENWAGICNERFTQKGLDVRISHLSLEKQGIDREATIHVGVAGTHMEKRGLESDRAKINREIIARNKALEPTKPTVEELQRERQKIAKEIAGLENKHVDKLARAEVAKTEAEIRKIEWHRRTYRSRISEIEKEIQNLSLEHARLNFFQVRQKAEISERINEYNEEKAKFEEAFLNRFNIDIYKSDELLGELRQKEELSKIYLEFNNTRRMLGKLKYKNVQHRENSENLSIEQQKAHLEESKRDFTKLGQKATDLQSRLKNVQFKGETKDIEWQTLHLETLNEQAIENLKDEITKISTWTDKGIYRLSKQAKQSEITPESTAEHIHELKQGYFIVDKEVSAIQQEINEIERWRTVTGFKIENMDERAEHIKTLKRQSSPSYKQAENYFKHEFSITPEEAPAEIERLEIEAAKMSKEQERLESYLPALLADKEAFLLEYRKQRAYVEVHRDRKRILAKLEQLEREISENLSPKERMARLKITSKLDEPEHEKIRLRERYRGR